MIDPNMIADLADRLQIALSDVGNELDGMREELGREPDAPGEGMLVEPFSIAHQLAELARAAKA